MNRVTKSMQSIIFKYFLRLCFQFYVFLNLHTDNIETVAVQMEWMTQVRLLYFINQNDFDDGIQWNIHFVGAHTVGSAVGRSVVSVAELLWIDVVVLREERRGR
jgi:hypothetical protein